MIITVTIAPHHILVCFSALYNIHNETLCSIDFGLNILFENTSTNRRTTPCNNTKHMKMKKRFTVLTQRTVVLPLISLLLLNCERIFILLPSALLGSTSLCSLQRFIGFGQTNVNTTNRTFSNYLRSQCKWETQIIRYICNT